jgi:hypothetical protein
MFKRVVTGEVVVEEDMMLFCVLKFNFSKGKDVLEKDATEGNPKVFRTTTL